MVLRPPKALSTQQLLIGVGLAVAAPLVALLAILLFRETANERAQLERRLQQVAESIVADVDRDIDRRLALLDTLASSPLVAAEEWPKFYEQAKAALKDRGYVVLVTSEGRQVINTYVPFGQQPLLTGNPETVRKVVAGKRPVASDLFISLVVKQPVYNVAIPVMRNGEVGYVMSIGLMPTELLKMLLSQGREPTWVLSIWDGNDTILARTAEQEKFVGTKLPKHLWKSNLPNGVSPTLDLYGRHVLRAVAPSKRSDWRISVSVPMEIATAPIRHSAMVWSGIAFLCLVLATLLGAIAGRFLEKPLADAAAAARAFGLGKEFVASSSPVREVNDLVLALSEAGQRQGILAGELTHRVKNILAVVQAVTTQSLRGAQSIEDARHDVTERLQSLARGHDILMRSEWRPAPLRDIINSEIQDFGDRVRMTGQGIQMPPEMILPLMLVLHELATNASKYGALSVPEGRVEITWLGSEEGAVTLTWRETGGPPVTPPDKGGFGTNLLKRAVPGGEADIVYAADGLCYRLSIPRLSIPPPPIPPVANVGIGSPGV